MSLEFARTPHLLTAATTTIVTIIMGPGSVGLSVLGSLVSFFALVWSWVRLLVTAVVPRISVVFTRVVRSISTVSGSYLSPISQLVSRYTTTPRYKIRVAALTVWAHFTGRSFVDYHAGFLPRLIARTDSRDIHVFPLTGEQITHIYGAVGIHPHTYQRRNWRPSLTVERYLHFANVFNQPLPTTRIDLTSYHLIGRRLTQGSGIVGSKFHLVLIEELGRWPGERGVIAGKVYSFERNEITFAKIPIRFVTVAGVEEEIEGEEVRITVEWQDMEEGMANGLKVKTVPLNSSDSLYDDDPPVPYLTLPE